jgi:hypothetical protein
MAAHRSMPSTPGMCGFPFLTGGSGDPPPSTISAPSGHLQFKCPSPKFLHHSLWEGTGVRRSHAGAEQLVRWIGAGQIDLLPEPGTITREKQGNDPSILDLAFCTPNLTPWVTSCNVIDNFGGSDHLAIETTIHTSQQDAGVKLAKHRNYKKADAETIRQIQMAQTIRAGAGQPTGYRQLYKLPDRIYSGSNK